MWDANLYPAKHRLQSNNSQNKKPSVTLPEAPFAKEKIDIQNCPRPPDPSSSCLPRAMQTATALCQCGVSVGLQPRAQILGTGEDTSNRSRALPHDPDLPAPKLRPTRGCLVWLSVMGTG